MDRRYDAAMWIVGSLAGLALIILVLADGFETILQPRRVTHRYRFSRFYYRNLWALWRAAALLLPGGKRRQAFLSVFGPLSLLGLFVSWLIGLIVGFALLHYSLATPVQAPDGQVNFGTYLYLSGTTLFTLGYGDVTPRAAIGRALSVAESGLGFGFLAAILSYLPALFQSYSRREVTISLMDARAGSPPSAAQLLERCARSGNVAAVDRFLAEWERWAAELLESHLSFPVLSYYRSQHDNQSWLAALTTILDICAVLIAEVERDSYQAQLTFAMARHAAVDVGLVLKTPPMHLAQERLPEAERQRLHEVLRQAGVQLRSGAEGDAKLAELRHMYEPYVAALAERFLLALPTIIPEQVSPDNWQRSAGMRPTPGIGSLPSTGVDDGHFH